MKLKKSILSLAAVMALSSTAMADNSATYLPLTTTAADASWILFGVNGFSNGIPSTTEAVATAFSTGFTSLEDTDATDDLAIAGLATGAAGTEMATLQGLKNTGLTSVNVGVDISAETYDPTEVVRTMYIQINSSSPNIKFDYKASLESKSMELFLDGSTTNKYYVTISQENTWSNPALPQDKPASASTVTDRTVITDALDTDSTDNPVSPSLWDKDTHMQTTVESATFYKFNAITQQWEVYRNNNTAGANDFTELEKGRAYWGRVDVADQVPTNDGDGATNLVLGSSGNTAQSQLSTVYVDDTNASTLTEGWNMIAFDDVKPYIRRAATGLVLTAVATADTLTVTDASGVYSVDLTI